MRWARVFSWSIAVAAGACASHLAPAGEPCERIAPGGPGDCNSNGFPDGCDLGPHALGYEVRELYQSPDDSSKVDVVLSFDFEPDGDPDIVLLREIEALSFTNRGGGVFGDPQSLSARPGSSGTLAIDIDGDRVTDIVTAEDRLGITNGSVSVFRGDVAGRFDPFRKFDLPEASFLAAGDLDGDERPELVVGTEITLRIGIYSFDEDIQLVPLSVITPGRPTFEAQLADFDRDGDLDVFLRQPFTYINDVQVGGLIWGWTNDGAGELAPGPVVEDPSHSDPTGFALLDLDGDGWLDVVYSAPGFSLGVLMAALNDRSSGFLAPVEIASITVPDSITGADFDGDGDEDLLVSTFGREAALFENLTSSREPAALDFVREGLSRDKIHSMSREAAAGDVDGIGGGEYVVFARDTGCGPPNSLFLLAPLREPRSADCDGNGIPDSCDIDAGGASDTDRNGIPDRCEPSPPIERCSESRDPLADCDANGIDDICDVKDATLDADRDGVPDVCQTASLAFGITGPGLLQGRPGEEIVAEYASRVYPGEDLLGLDPGLQGWSLSIRAYNCEVIWATTSGTAGGEFCDGGLRRLGFERTRVSNQDGFQGAGSFAVLSTLEPITLSLGRPGVLLRLGVRVIVPDLPETTMAMLVHEDGARIGGSPLKNTATRLGATIVPELFGRSITVVSMPERFRRADANTDGIVDLSDGIHTLSNLFLGGPRSTCRDAADFDDSGQVDITDAIATFQMLFLGGPRPSDPGKLECGVDPTADSITCLTYGACE